MAYIGYLFFRIIVFIFSIIPFWLLYKIADFLAWVLKTVVGYRKKVVLAQLKLAFPYKSDKEIQKIMEAYPDADRTSATMYITTTLTNQKVFDFLEKSAN